MKPKVKKLNVRLLRRVQKAILRHADQFQMSCWKSNSLDDEDSSAAGGCGTAACIGGWAVFLHGKYKKVSQIPKQTSVAAHDAIGLSYNKYNESPLFFVDEWPQKFISQWDAARTAKQQARVAVRRIDYFIKTGQ
jgi:hypothetical protein